MGPHSRQAAVQVAPISDRQPTLPRPDHSRAGSANLMGVSVSPGKRFVKRWSRRLFSLTGRILGRSGITPGVRILTYHRIENDPADPFALSPTDFIHQMEILVSSGALVSLTDSLQHLTGSRSPIPRIVVTFDDGTSDFLHNAFPVLSRLMI